MAVRSGQAHLANLPWLPDDTEESVVGAEVHQLAITMLSHSLQKASCCACMTARASSTVTEQARRIATLEADLQRLCVDHQGNR